MPTGALPRRGESAKPSFHKAEMAKRKAEDVTVLVTGGTGLVGKGIEAAVKKEGVVGERWIYLSSKDGDLR